MEQDRLSCQRHSAAHLLAMAVLELRPGAKLGIGPVIETGFYYDFDLSKPLAPEDLLVLEEKISELAKKNFPFVRRSVSRKEAQELFRHQPYKLELIEEIPPDEEITVYDSGGLSDLCQGPHVSSSGQVGAVKLLSLAGAYWRGSERNPMLQRVYGTAFATEEELAEYLKNLELSKERDHRLLGERLGYYTISEAVGPGLPLWLPDGAMVYRLLEDYMYRQETSRGYRYVKTPHIADGQLFHQSGHLPYYGEAMYPPIKIEGRDYYLKPMNCPHHHQIALKLIESYRDLPLRLAEGGMTYRYELSGTLSGLIRTRGFATNDGHIYCRMDQVKEEVGDVLGFLREVYTAFAITDYRYRLSLPDFVKNPKKYGGDRKVWEEASQIIRDSLDQSGVPFSEEVGEAAFYGPKMDVQIKNILGKEETIATSQIDVLTPPRVGLTFTNPQGQRETMIVIHRAILGSFERFIALLLERTGGDLPLWLAPVQVAVLPVSEKSLPYATTVLQALKEHPLRTWLDESNESMAKKIRRSELRHHPIMLIVGEKEEKSRTVALRTRGAGDGGPIKLGEVLNQFNFAPPDQSGEK